MCTITPNWPASKSVKNRLLSKSVDVDLQCFMVMYFQLYIVSLVCKNVSVSLTNIHPPLCEATIAAIGPESVRTTQ